MEKKIWKRKCGQQDTSRGLEEDGGGKTQLEGLGTNEVRGLCSTQILFQLMTKETQSGKDIWRRKCGQQDTSEGLEADGSGSTEQN